MTAAAAATAPPRAVRRRVGLRIRGAVQGVGFRPFVYRLASELGLCGWVANDPRGVILEAEGDEETVRRFLDRLPRERPPLAVIESCDVASLPAGGETGFTIRESLGEGAPTAVVPPDAATCPDCLREILDPADRRHGYPFTNCTNCGPRFTIVEALPYDRPHTTMRGFRMCAACAAEYGDPADRRFHAQPNACPACGPSLALLEPAGTVAASGAGAIAAAAAALRAGRIVAVKGLGGFHLMIDARDAAAIARLRERKPRRDKPFAVMVHDLGQALGLARVSAGAASLLTSPEAPIVLLERRPDAPVAANVAPGVGTIGIMLPAMPLHHLLLHSTGIPLVATSGNLRDEPICTDEREAIHRLGGLADLFLVHDRPIARHVDDSVTFILRGAPRVLRRARGYAPLPVRPPADLPPILAVGAHLKNTVALGFGRQVFLSQHIGDLETPEALKAFERVIADFLRLYGARPVALAHDLHPDYLSTRWARGAAILEHGGADGGAEPRRIGVQHHHAHLAACLADNGAGGRALGITWDGTGYGTDGTIWGGEFLLGDARRVRRIARLRPFRLPGGEAAVREPRRVALALLWDLFGADALERDDLPPVRHFGEAERHLLGRMLARGVNAPLTSSMGRLFDGIAALAGLRQHVTYEGQAAADLEHAADAAVRDAYPLPVEEDEGAATPFVLDWRPLVGAVLHDVHAGTRPGVIAARFHNAVVEAAVRVADLAGETNVALTGGCFQNRRLTESLARRLEEARHTVLLHRQVPPNDGGISLGQVLVAAARLRDGGPDGAGAAGGPGAAGGADDAEVI